MIKTIKKRTGDIVKFNAQKITDAIKKANMESIDETFSKEQLSTITNNVIKALKNLKTPGVEQIQDAVEKVLIAGNFASTAKAYILYRAEHTKLRQAKADLMDIYNELTFTKAKDADIKRENANIDADTAMGTMLKYGSEGSKYFITSHILPKDIAVAHMDGDIHIHDMDFYMLTETCCQIDLLKLFKNGFSTGHGYLREPNDIRSYAALACIAIQANQNEMHGGQAVPMFDYCMAPGVAKTYRKQYYKALGYYFNAMLDMKLEDASLLCKKIEQTLPIKISMSTADKFGKLLVDFLPKHQREHNYQEINEQTTQMAHKFAINTAWNETNAATYQAMEAFIHNLNTMNSRAGAQVPFSSINYGTDTSPEGRMAMRNLLLATDAGLGDGETPIFPVQIFKVKEGVNYEKDDPNYDLFRLAMKTSAKRLFPNFSFLDAPFNKKYYKPNDYNSEVAYMGCRTRVMGNVYDPTREVTCGRGNLSFTSINLPRLAIEAKGDINKFYKSLDDMIDLVIRQLLHRFKIQCAKIGKNYPFLMGQNIWLDSDNIGEYDTVSEVLRHGTLTVGFIGLAETLKALIGKHHGESAEAQKLGLAIIGHMRKRMDDEAQKTKLNFSLIATPAEGLSGRFVKIDRKIYGSIPGVTDREYYTNSFHIPVYYPISAYKKIQLEAPYHNLTNGGHISYIEMDGDPTKNLTAFEAIIRCMHDNGIGYGSVNHPVDRDPVCGYTGIINGVCPKCGRSEAAHKRHVILKRMRDNCCSATSI
ncbi:MULTISPECIES: anaerobic ribonucleoside triphosphate reductase [Megamonas]|jgi:anaerobic ribonucleoside-triphosphate reductase|uniref:Anaerobic ribonucleoside triphosphate reductase n=1 Tax=Megamonas rupellensis TaxID=491921 RepID=A0A412CBN3_9FIRM|nr:MULTISPECIES: anaerobic ribonucleoside triphosphate reductase [Megamonas]MBM6749670.1 anaerobic ribonucleoside triphosphate reductase [Megamonas rupellensis]NJE29291.1 anaerobic ribonucleoside triphosphate reductase [Megamonas funiformis]RGN99579.1 anaerobic ribonucleoside triphosphate reductase [Megamonas rupellensis]RGQ02179.1 anaerobic ribonucleoside triphosphate reductase [Megamonas rupellensis]RGQ76885.1 anaerobic ribonucleoside triphosphate reductase [Megamonas rupellensis]